MINKKPPTPRGRPKEEGRFVWQGVATLKRIGDELGTDAVYGIAVYVALSQVSSWNGNASTFQVEVAKIAGIIRIGSSKTRKTLHELERIGVITIVKQFKEGGKEREANIYTLLSIPTKTKEVHSNRAEGPVQGKGGVPCNSFFQGNEQSKEVPKGPSVKEKEGQLASAPAPLEAGGATALAKKGSARSRSLDDGWDP